MKEYIEREAVCNDCANLKICVNKSLCPVGRAPAADVVERKRGEWIETEDGEVVCSICGIRIPEMYSNADSIINSECRFCHYCGAKMGGKLS